MIGKFHLLVGSMALLLVSACGGGDSELVQEPVASEPRQELVACTASFEPGILIRVTDSASGDPISCGARAVVTANTYSEIVDFPADRICFDTEMLLAAFERPGTYAVTVSKSGYLDFIINDVVVKPGVCHVIPVTVEARLSPI